MSQFRNEPQRSVSRSPVQERLVIAPRGFTCHWRGRGGALKSRTLSKGLLCGVGAAVLLLTAWAGSLTAYVMLHDDMALSLRQSWQNTDQVYEDRIANLSGMLDRVTSKQMIERETLERKVELLLKRQAMIETRQSIVGQVMESAGLRREAKAPLQAPLPPLPVRESTSETGQRHSALSGQPDLFATIDQLARRMDANEQADVSLLSRIEEQAYQRSRRLKGVFAEIGVEAIGAAKSPKTTAMGGPYVPLSNGISVFDQQIERLQAAVSEVESLERSVAQLPLRRPMSGEIEQTSGFGARIDPFLKTWALHAGLDFRGNTGDPIRVTAGGRVVHAGMQAGYGLMVEVEHAAGISTRYAHMSHIAVAEGEGVRAGQLIGRVGSTGRSTGPHLHYETRVDGEAVDPMRFLRAGQKLSFEQP